MKKTSNAVLKTEVEPFNSIELIPLKNLVKSPRNVRTTPAPLAGLPNSILAHGIYLNLLVTEVKKNGKPTGMYAVEAGGRRLEALNYLLEQGKITADYPVKVLVISEDDATNASLVENKEREAMHPADEYVAFQTLVNEGKSVAHIANVFNMREIDVKRRLRLANASKEIFAEFRLGKITLEQLMTLCLTENHEHQNLVWFRECQSWEKNPNNLRKAITTDELPVTHKKVLFVGIENYLTAGGTTRIDLFSEEGKGDTVVDIPLLDKLVQEKLITEADKVQAEGWGWVEFSENIDHEYLNKFGRIYKSQRELSAEEVALYEAIEQRKEALEVADTAHQETDYDEDEEAEQAAVAILQAEQDAIDADENALDATTHVWPDSQNIAGVFLSIGGSGNLDRREGLLRAADAKKAQLGNQEGDGSEQTEPETTNDLSNSLQQCLTAHRTGGLQVAVANNPAKALVLLTHKLVLSSFDLYRHSYGRSAVTTSQNTTTLYNAIPNYEDSETAQAINEIGLAWLKILPPSADDLLDWMLAQPQDVVLGLLAYCTGRSVDVTSTQTQSNQHYQKLGALFDLDIRKTWKPTAENYFSRVSKTQMLDVVAETGGKISVDADKVKKSELAKLSADAVSGFDWLPDLLKIN